MSAENKCGETALHIAAKGATNVVGFLLASGFITDAKDKCGNTPLIWAAKGGYATIVTELLAVKVDIRAVNSVGFSALMYAAQGGHQQIVQALLASCDAMMPLKMPLGWQ